MKSLLKSLSSVKLAIVLLIIITLASVVGTFIPQQRSMDEYIVRFGQTGHIFIFLGFTNLYHSLWFISLLFLFSLNILICTLTRFSPKLRRALRPKLEKEAKKLLALKTKDDFRKNWSLAKTIEVLKKELSSKHYRLKEEHMENKVSLIARKKISGIFGSDIVHLGLLIILAGGIIGGFSGFKENLTLSEGQILPVSKADFKIRLDKFETEFYPNGSVKDWKSSLTVIENGTPHISKIIEVNHPLSYKGYMFYQSEYGWDWENPVIKIWVKKRDDPSYLKKVDVKIKERVKLEEENIEILALHFIPDFVINEKNEITTRSLQPNNPAALIEGWQEKKKIFSGWIFAKFPDFDRITSEKEINLSFELKDFKAGQYSVIRAAKNPGVNFIWIGCGFLMIGLALAFYWPPREIKMILEESYGKTEIIAGGIASKNREAFLSEFEKIMTSIRKSK